MRVSYNTLFTNADLPQQDRVQGERTAEFQGDYARTSRIADLCNYSVSKMRRRIGDEIGGESRVFAV